MKTFIIFTILLLFLYGLSYSQSQSELLEKAYQENLPTLLDSFFINWQNEIKPISEEELNTQNDTVKAVYELFSYVYQPFNLTRISNSNYSSISEAFTKVKYAVIQNAIFYRFVDKYVNPHDTLAQADTIPGFSKGIYEDAGLDSVLYFMDMQNFSPIVNPQLKTVYLNDKYLKILTSFLEGSPYSFDEVTKRYNFLHQMIEFIAPFYSGFSLITWPWVIGVDFTKDFLKAWILYGIKGEWWLMFLEKIDNKWVYRSHKHHGSD